MKVSILICSKNSQKYLVDVLNSIFKLDNKNLLSKIVLADYKSDDKTIEIFSDFIKKNNFDGLIIPIDEIGKSRALEVGLDFIASTDSTHAIIQDTDNILDSNFLKNLEKKIQLHPNTGIFGSKGIFFDKKISNSVKNNFPNYLNNFAVGDQYPREGDIHYFYNKFGLWGACSAINLNHWKYLRNNGFKFFINPTRQGETFPNVYFAGGEDTELAILMQIAGFQCKFYKDLIFYHLIDNNRVHKKFIIDFFEKSAVSNYIIKALIYHLSKVRTDKKFKFFLFKNIYRCLFHELLILFKSIFTFRKDYLFNIEIHFKRFYKNMVFFLFNLSELKKLRKSIDLRCNKFFENDIS
tara:strand:- start:293 stop:1348 length:1056 start_codon:yes stop_codon:yes gene_type:complete